MNHTRSFDEVRGAVIARANRMLPDTVAHVSDLSMDNDGHISGPRTPLFALNDWSRRQLAAQLGIRWNKWMDKATPSERAEEVTRRLSRTPGEMKIRAWRDDTGQADGIARAFLSPGFSPIDDSRIFDRLALNLRGALDDYRFTSIETTESTSHFTAVRVEAMDLGNDPVRPGWRLRNSEVGGAALSIDDYFLRQVCSNGMMVQIGGKRALYRTHRRIDDDHLAASLVIALGKLPERWNTAFNMMHAAKGIDVPHPDTAVIALLDSPEVPKALADEAAKAVLKDNDHTRFGVVQAVTWVAHALNDDPDIRFAMERLAGDYLTAEVAMAA